MKRLLDRVRNPDGWMDIIRGCHLRMDDISNSAFRIGPIINFHIKEINEESEVLIEEHATKWPNEVR